MIKVAVAGCAGRMGSAVVDAVTAADDMEVACGIDPHGAEAGFPVYASVAEAVAAGGFDVLVDFTQPDVVAGNLAAALPAGVDCVVGTTGLANDVLEALAAQAAPGTCLFYAPNFTTGAVLMMEFARAAAPYFPEAEVIEFHHCNKKDAPSGTAVRTAQMIAEARAPRVSAAPGRETEVPGAEGARARCPAPRARAARSSTACRCTRCGPWATWPRRRSSSARSARRSPCATTRGTAAPTCPASCWASAASAPARASSWASSSSWTSVRVRPRARRRRGGGGFPRPAWVLGGGAVPWGGRAAARVRRVRGFAGRAGSV